MFCRKCGEPIPENSELCPICGENQGITMTTEETEKGTNGSVGKTAGKILKGAAGTAVTIIGSMVVPIVGEEVGKGMKKAVKKGTSNILKMAGLKRKTPLDMASKVIKIVQKKVGK